MICAAVLKGRTVHPGVELGIAPGSRQVLAMLSKNGALADLVSHGMVQLGMARLEDAPSLLASTQK